MNTEEDKTNNGGMPQNIFDVPEMDATKTIETINSVNDNPPSLKEEEVLNEAFPSAPTPIEDVPEVASQIAQEVTPFPNEAPIIENNVVPFANENISNYPVTPQAVNVPPVMEPEPVMEPVIETPEVTLEKKLVKEEMPELPVPNNKGNKIIGLLSSILVILVIGFGLYFLMHKGIIPNPFKVDDKDVILPNNSTTTTTTTTKNINTIYGNYEGMIDTCPNVPMNLLINSDNGFSLTLVNKTCTPSVFTGTITNDETTKTITFASTNETFSGVKNGETLDINYQNNSYILKLK